MALLLCVACLGPTRVKSPGQLADPNDGRLVGISTASGDTVMFDEEQPRSSEGFVMPAPHVVRDTVWATVEGEPYRLPASEVERYWIRQTSILRTVGLVTAVFAGVYVAFGALLSAGWND